MKYTTPIALVAGMVLTLSAGCEKPKEKTELKITTPGGSTTISAEKEVKKTGSAPPATP